MRLAAAQVELWVRSTRLAIAVTTGVSPGKPAMSSAPGQWPLVSVILPTRGRSELVRQALASVIGQTYLGTI